MCLDPKAQASNKLATGTCCQISVENLILFAPATARRFLCSSRCRKIRSQRAGRTASSKLLGHYILLGKAVQLLHPPKLAKAGFRRATKPGDFHQHERTGAQLGK